MQILVDADACPVKQIIVLMTKEKNIPVTKLIDMSHELNNFRRDGVVQTDYYKQKSCCWWDEKLSGAWEGISLFGRVFLYEEDNNNNYGNSSLFGYDAMRLFGRQPAKWNSNAGF